MAEVMKMEKDVTELSSIIYKRTKTTLEESYVAYLADNVAGEAKLFQTVFKLALSKINKAVFDTGDAEQTAEDHAQEVTIYVWEHLADFKGHPNSFYPWVTTICFHRGARAHNESIKSSEKHVPLLIESEDGSGVMEDNPLIYARKNVIRPTPMRKIPDYIQGKDRIAADWIGEGMNYKFIAKSMGTTENAVKLRVAKIRKRVMAENAKSKKA